MPIYFNVNQYNTNMQLVSNLGVGAYRFDINLTKDAFLTIWNGLVWDAPISAVCAALSPYTQNILLPGFNPGSGAEWDESAVSWDSLSSLFSYISQYHITLNPATDIIGIVDGDGNGLYSSQYLQYFYINGNQYGPNVSGQFGYTGMSNSWRGNVQQPTLRASALLIIRTTDAQYGIVSLYYNKNNSTLGWWSVQNSAIIEEWYSNVVPVTPDNPYAPGGTTGPGGGGGVSYDGLVHDSVDFPTPPAISASNAGFVSIWTPTLDQMQTMARWLWTTDPTKIEFWQKLITNPLDLIFGIYILPISIHHTDDETTPTSDELVALNDRISLGWMDTGIGMDYILEQYVEMDMGSIDIEECWGAFLDYEPYTKIDIYLPYIGVKSLDTNECMPKTISLKYMIDIATGTCIALIKCDDSVYYHFVGNCASQIPITAVQMQEVVKGVMSIAVGAATFAIGGEYGAGAHASKKAVAKGAAMQAGGAAMAGSGADNVAKGPRYSHSGTMAAAAGIMDVQTPYLIFSRPKQAMPEEQQKYTGYPSFMTKELSELEGYTEVQIIHLHNMSCTTDEVQELEELLISGVIF